MPTRIDTLTDVPEDRFQELIQDFREIDNADIVTAFRDENGRFTVESTIFDRTPGSTIVLNGTMSFFGGPDDNGVRPDEGLALFDPADVAANPDLFLSVQPPGTTGLARRLNPDAAYIACRWDYSLTPKSFLKRKANTVKVSNPANNKSIMVRPVDWGPNVVTGRIADLSPGVTDALGLDTDDACKVEIPTPVDAQLPPVGRGVAVGVNVAAIDATIFPPGMTRKLVVMTTSNNITYWVVNQIGTQDGGQSLLRKSGNQPAEILLSDSTVFPIKASAKIPAEVAAELNKAFPKLVASDGPGGNPPQPGDDINDKMFRTAKKFVGHDTSDVPGTDGGNLACAWAVNEVTRLALGKPISRDGDGNGLSTIGIFDALNAHHTKLNSANGAVPGAIIIAPTEGSNHGHVGIVGENREVFSNKSVPGEFAQNFTIKTFTDRYVGKGLDVFFYLLNRNQF